MRRALAAVLALASTAGAAAAQSDPTTSPEPGMTCAQFLKLDAGASQMPATGNAEMDRLLADSAKKLTDYCTKNPNATAADAAQKIMTQ